jgi:hypothetical protein
MNETRLVYELKDPEALWTLDTTRDTPEGDQRSAIIGMVEVLREKAPSWVDETKATLVAAEKIHDDMLALPWEDSSHFKGSAPIDTYEQLTSMVDEMESLIGDADIVARWEGEANQFYIAEMEMAPDPWGDDYIISDAQRNGMYSLSSSNKHLGDYYSREAAIIEAEARMEHDGCYPSVWVEQSYYCSLVVVESLIVDGVTKVGAPVESTNV